MITSIQGDNMKKIFTAVLLLVFTATLAFAGYVDEVKSFKGKKVEIVLVNNPNTIKGLFTGTEDMMNQPVIIILTGDNGEKIIVFYAYIAAIKEIK
jgi:small nuclear ribonucleoprotein (snRNP)-like protein